MSVADHRSRDKLDAWREIASAEYEDAAPVSDAESFEPAPAPYAAEQGVLRWLRICTEAREAMQSVGATGDVETFISKAIEYYAAHVRRSIGMRNGRDAA
jgi:hypothetical protein